MLSLVVTVLLIGLAASELSALADPSPPNYRIPTFPINPLPGPHPIAQGGFEHNGLPSSKYHKEQVPVLQQQAVAVPKVQVVTNERVKVVTQTKNVPVPVYKVKEVVKHIPIKKVARVPVMVHNKEYIPVIKKQVNTVVKEVPKVITNTVVKNVPIVHKVPKILTKHYNHVQTKVLHKPVPKPYAVRVDNPVAVPNPVVHKVQVKVPVAVPKVHVQTRTKFVDRPVYRTVVQEKPVHHTVVKTVQKPVPKPIPFMQTQIVKQFVPKIKKVVQHFPVPKIVTQHHVQKVAVPMVKTQTVVKNVPRPHLVTQYVDRVKTIHKKVPVKVPIVHHQKVPMIQEKIVPQIIEQIKPQIVVRDNVRTVVKNHVQQVPKIIRELVDRPVIHKVVVPDPKIILKETHKETIQPVQLAKQESVRYYQIDATGKRIPISPAFVSNTIANRDTGIRQSGVPVQGGNIGIAGLTGVRRVDPRISAIQAGMSSLSSRGISMTPGILAGIAASRRTHGGQQRIGQRYGLNNAQYLAAQNSAEGIQQSIGQLYGPTNGLYRGQNSAGGIQQSIGQLYGPTNGLYRGQNSAGAGAAGGSIGTINLQQEEKSSAANFGLSGASMNMMGANVMNHPAAAIMNSQAQQAAQAAQAGVMHRSQYAGMFKNLNTYSNDHILAKVTGA